MRPLNGFGFTQNVLTSHAVAFRPRAIRMNENFCPVEKLDRVAFEPCLFLSLEPALKLLSLYLHPWRMDDATLSEFGAWAASYFFDVNRRESQKMHAYIVSRPIPPPQRRRAELASQFFIGQMNASRQIFRLWRLLADRGQLSAARWLAAAHVQMRLRRRLAVRLPVTIFVPEESALGLIAAEEQLRLLSGGGALLATLRAHVAEGRHTIARGDRLVPSDAGPIRMIDGASYAISDQGSVRVTAGPIHLDEIDVYCIDRPLVPLALRPATAADRLDILARSVRRRSGHGSRRAKSALVQLLSRNRRVFRLVADLRGEWLRKSRQGPDHIHQVDHPELALATYRRALAFRSLDALRQLYGFYRCTVLDSTGVPVAPEQRLDRPTALGEEASALLSDVVRSWPNFAEAWLELGYARLDVAQPDAALDAFTHAALLPPTLPLGRFDPDPRIVAALEQARLLMVRDRPSDALAALEAVALTGPIPRGLHALRARLLLGAGRLTDALDTFDRCMQNDHIHQSFAGLLPRNLNALEAELDAVALDWVPSGKRYRGTVAGAE
ncbi:fasciclin domain-containing protein [Bradyrhizobium sp.]|uniref:fasciclin domain-containing protein n=1 Tax=Bradyrhizobium sp. TaxID=376 RepID=UPI003C4F83D2